MPFEETAILRCFWNLARRKTFRPLRLPGRCTAEDEYIERLPKSGERQMELVKRDVARAFARSFGFFDRSTLVYGGPWHAVSRCPTYDRDNFFEISDHGGHTPTLYVLICRNAPARYRDEERRRNDRANHRVSPNHSGRSYYPEAR